MQKLITSRAAQKIKQSLLLCWSSCYECSLKEAAELQPMADPAGDGMTTLGLVNHTWHVHIFFS